LAKRDRPGQSNLSINFRVSVRGEIRPRFADATGRCFHPFKCREGQARHTTGEFIQFISHAEGSTAELETQLILSVELKFVVKEQTTNEFILLDDIRRMLNGLRRKLSAAS
jgi:hypothetical protein